MSSRVFNALDNYLWKLTFKLARYRHSNKPVDWIVKRYFGQFNPHRRDHWVFGDRHSGTYLPRFAWTKIVRHQMVPGRASPDDPALAQFWADRRRKGKPPLDSGILRLLHEQDGCCPLCRDYLLHADHEPASPDEWAQWVTATRKAITRYNVVARGGLGTPDECRLVHSSCRQRETANGNEPRTASNPEAPTRLA